MLRSRIPGHPSFLNVWGMATSDLSSPMGLMQQKALQSEVWLPRFTTVHSTHLSSRWAGKKPLHLVRKNKKGSTREAKQLNLMSFRGRVRPHWEGTELPEWVMDGVLLIWPSQCDKSRRSLVLLRCFKSSTLPSLRRRVNFNKEKLCCFPESPQFPKHSFVPQAPNRAQSPFSTEFSLDTEQLMSTGSVFCCCTRWLWAKAERMASLLFDF